MERALSPTCSRLRRKRLSQGLGTEVAARLWTRGHGHEVAARSKPGAAHRLGRCFIGHRIRQQVLQRRVVESAPGGLLVAQTHAVDGGGGGQSLDNELVQRAPGLCSLVEPAGTDASAGIVDAGGDHLRVRDGNDPGLSPSESRCSERRDDVTFTARWGPDRRREARVPDAQPPVEPVQDATATTGQRDRGIDEPLKRGPVGHQLIEVVDHGEPLGDLTPCSPLLTDERSHVATVADFGTTIQQS